MIDLRNKWIGSKNGQAIRAFSSQYRAGYALSNREIDSAFPIDQYKSDQLGYWLARWDNLYAGS